MTDSAAPQPSTPDPPKKLMGGGHDPREMARRSAEVRRAKREQKRAQGDGSNAPGSAADSGRTEAMAALMRIVKSRGNDAAVVSAAKAVLDAERDVAVDLQATGLEGLTDEELDARVVALRQALASA